MKRWMWVSVLLATVVLLVPVSELFAINVNEGQWAITVEAEMPGMPMKMPPMTMQQCITANSLVPKDSGQQPNCKMENSSVQGNTVTWTMVCQQPEGTLTSKGRVTYSGDTFEGETKTTIPGEEKMEMTSKMKGKRIGPCE